MKNYEVLKSLSEVVNKAIWKLILAFVAEAIFYYPIGLNAIFHSTATLRQIRTFVLSAHTCLIFFICGDCCKIVEDSLVEWLDWKASKTYTKKSELVVSSERMQALLYQAKCHAVGISGYLFVLDFGSVLSVSMTLVITHSGNSFELDCNL